MMYFFISLIVFFTSAVAVTPAFEELRLDLTPAQQELFLNNGLNRGILDAPKDRNKPLFHEWMYSFRTFNEFTTRQYTGFTLIDSTFLVPTQPRFVDGVDAQSAPIIDSVNVAARTYFKTHGIQIGNCKIASIIEAYFGGLVYIGSLYSVWNAYINFNWDHTQLIIGQHRHPFAIDETAPNLVALNWGSPITPALGISPQIAIIYQWSPTFETEFTLYSQHLIPDNGPYSFTSEYIRWSDVPGINFRFNVRDKNAWWGAGINFKRIRPRLITNNNLVLLAPNAADVFLFEPPVLAPDYVPATGEVLNSVIVSAYAVLERGRVISKTQFLYGGNGVELFSFGGYGVSAMTVFPNQGPGPQPTYQWQYTNIPFISIFNDTEFAQPYRHIQPGIFIGFAKPLPTNTPLVRDPTTGRFVIFTLDDAFQGNERVTNAGALPQRVFTLWRVSPRCWVSITERMQIGAELTLLSALYGQPNENYRPIDGHRVTMMRITFCAHFGF